MKSQLQLISQIQNREAHVVKSLQNLTVMVISNSAVMKDSDKKHIDKQVDKLTSHLVNLKVISSLGIIAN